MTKWKLLDYLYPPHCPVCDRILQPGQGGTVCVICRSLDRPRQIHAPYCLKCGKPLENFQQECCRDCRKHPPVFTQGRATFWYREMEDAMHRFKNRGRQEYAQFYGKALSQVYREVQSRWQVQALVPIPIHRSRMRQRGYNQAELLGRELSRRSGIPVREDLLVRRRKTGYQRMLDDQARRENVRDAFRVAGTDHPKACGQLPERILLVDDIYTTGSTMNEAAGTLLAAGAKQIYCLSVCIGKGY